MTTYPAVWTSQDHHFCWAKHWSDLWSGSHLSGVKIREFPAWLELTAWARITGVSLLNVFGSTLGGESNQIFILPQHLAAWGTIRVRKTAREQLMVRWHSAATPYLKQSRIFTQQQKIASLVCASKHIDLGLHHVPHHLPVWCHLQTNLVRSCM